MRMQKALQLQACSAAAVLIAFASSCGADGQPIESQRSDTLVKSDVDGGIGELTDMAPPDNARTNASNSAASVVSSSTAQIEGPQAPVWASSMIPPPTDCVYEYPADLAERPIAFDGTILSVTRGEYIDEALAAPVDLVIEVNQVFRGDLIPTVTMHTWDFSEPDADVWDPTGARILAAASESMDVMECGFTRPYNAEEAEAWETAFG